MRKTAATYEPNHVHYSAAAKAWNRWAESKGIAPLAAGAPVPYWEHEDKTTSPRVPEKKPRKKGGLSKFGVAWEFKRNCKSLSMAQQLVWFHMWLAERDGRTAFAARDLEPGVGRTAAANAVRRLVELGLIEVVHKSRKPGVRSVYKINQNPCCDTPEQGEP